ELGYKLVIVPVVTLFTAFKAMKEVLERMKVDGLPLNVLDKMVNFNEFVEFIGVPEVQKLEQKYVTRVRK
ncbi:carboxyvinyl-carboxyphosphonate phosphorylmutase, partial [Sulfolobus sp. D5]